MRYSNNGYILTATGASFWLGFFRKSQPARVLGASLYHFYGTVEDVPNKTEEGRLVRVD